MLKPGDKIAIVACSNALPISFKPKMEQLLKIMDSLGIIPVCCNHIYETYSVFSGDARDKAQALMEFFQNPQIKAIFDISGGDIANEILPHLDYQQIMKNYKPFFGYSDLTTVINALYTKTGYPAYLYQIRNLLYDNRDEQKERFTRSILHSGTELCGEKDLYDFKYSFIQGKRMEGIVVGGNIRCFLKLAGTPYIPDFADKILFLESLGGDVPLMTTYLNQYKQMGVFQKIKGILLGTFTNMEKERLRPTIEELVVKVVGDIKMPIAKTDEIGHGADSRCLVIGKKYILEENFRRNIDL